MRPKRDLCLWHGAIHVTRTGSYNVPEAKGTQTNTTTPPQMMGRSSRRSRASRQQEGERRQPARDGPTLCRRRHDPSQHDSELLGKASAHLLQVSPFNNSDKACKTMQKGSRLRSAPYPSLMRFDCCISLLWLWVSSDPLPQLYPITQLVFVGMFTYPFGCLVITYSHTTGISG